MSHHVTESLLTNNVLLNVIRGYSAHKSQARMIHQAPLKRTYKMRASYTNESKGAAKRQPRLYLH